MGEPQSPSAAAGAGPTGVVARRRCSICPASARRRAGSASISTLEPTSAKPKTVTANARPGKIEGHQWPVMMFW